MPGGFSPSLQDLKVAIARELGLKVKSYDLVDTCVGLGLSGGEFEEANSSKEYVERRIALMTADTTVALAQAVVDRFEGFQLRESVRCFLVKDNPRITIVTRQRLASRLADAPFLPGSLCTFKTLESWNST